MLHYFPLIGRITFFVQVVYLRCSNAATSDRRIARERCMNAVILRYYKKRPNVSGQLEISGLPAM
jgi:hypothetical protein